MDDYGVDDILDVEETAPRRGKRSKPVKRKWREIEALKDRQRLRKELADLDIFGDHSDDVDLI